MRNFLVGLFLVVTAFFSREAFGQCYNSFLETAYPSAITPSTSEVSYSMGSGTYLLLNVTAGTIYRFNACGNAWDTQISGHQDGVTTYTRFYNDDFRGCGLQSHQVWTADFTGVLRLSINKYSCAGYQGSGTGNSMILKVQAYNSSITTPNITATPDVANNKVDLKWTDTDNGLLLYLPFEDGSGTTATDWSANNNNSPLSSIDYGYGKFGKGAVLNADADYINIPDQGGTNITAMAWYYYGSAGTDAGWNTLFCRDGGTYHHVLINDASGEIGFYNSAFYGSGRTLTTGQWYHIAVTKTGTTSNLYLNGHLIQTSTSSFDNNSAPLGVVGNYSSSGGVQGCWGTIDELRIYNRVLGNDEIIRLMQGGLRSYTLNKGTSNSYGSISLLKAAEYDANFFDIDNFEVAGDDWTDRNSVNPSISTGAAYSGGAGLYCPSSWGRNFESGTYESGQPAGYGSDNYPYLSMAYKIPAGRVVNMLINVNGNWRSITMTQCETPTGYPKVGTWNPIIADNNWHYTTINLDQQLDAYLGAGNHTVASIIWHDGGGCAGIAGDFYIDDFMASKNPPYAVNTYSDTQAGDVAAPPVPTLTLNATSSTNIDVSWGAVSDNGSSYYYYVQGYDATSTVSAKSSIAGATLTSGMNGYEVVSGGGPGANGYGYGTATSYSDNGLTPNTQYCYQIRSRDVRNNISALSTPTTCKWTQATCPTSFTATPVCGGQVNLAWGGGAWTNVRIRNNTTSTDVYTGPATSYSQTGMTGGTYSYTLYARNGEGAEITCSTVSGVVVTEIPVLTSVVAQTDQTLNSATGKNIISWTGTLAAGQQFTLETTSPTAATIYTGTATSYTHSSLTDNTTYCYRVKIGSCGYSATKCAITKDRTKPATEAFTLGTVIPGNSINIDRTVTAPTYFGNFTGTAPNMANHGATFAPADETGLDQDYFYLSNSGEVKRFDANWNYLNTYSGLDLYTGITYDRWNNRFYAIDWSNKQWSAFDLNFNESGTTGLHDMSVGGEPIDAATDGEYIYTNHRNGQICRNSIATNAQSCINMDALAGIDWGGQGITLMDNILYAGTSTYGTNSGRIYAIDISNWSSPKIMGFWDATGSGLTEISGLANDRSHIYAVARAQTIAAEYDQYPVANIERSETSSSGPWSSVTPVMVKQSEKNYFTWDIDDFEATGDLWNARNGGTPVRSTTTSYTGSYSLYMGTWDANGYGRNFEATNQNVEAGQTTPPGYNTNDYPYMAMAYKIPAASKVNMLINVNGTWHSVTMTQGGSTSGCGYPYVGTWNDGEALIADDQWHYKIINIDKQLDAALGTGVHNVQAIIWHTSSCPGASTLGGAFYIDNFTVARNANFGGDVANDPTAQDKLAPTSPGVPTVTPASSTSMNISWAASTDQGNTYWYRTQVFDDLDNYGDISGVQSVNFTSGLNGYFVNETTGNSGASTYGYGTGTSYSDSGLLPNTQYCYQVKAKDNVNNETGYTTTVCAYTLASCPTSFRAISSGCNSVQLIWEGGIYTNVRIRNNTTSTDVYTGTATTFTQTGLTPGTTYSYTLYVRNGDNVETTCSTVTATLATNPTITVTDAGCNGAADGIITIAPGTSTNPNIAFGAGTPIVNAGKYKAITLGYSGTALTNQQVQITVAYDSDMQTDFDDLRFYDANGNSLSYWIEKYTASSSAVVWIKVPSIPNGGATIYMTYNNGTVGNHSNGENVFEFFDNFDGPALNTAKWTAGTIAATSGTNMYVSNGSLFGGNNSRYIISNQTFTGNYVMETRIFETTTPANGFTTLGFYNSPSDCIGTLSHSGPTSYIRNDGTWISFGFNPVGQWVRDVLVAQGTGSIYYRTGETSGAANSGSQNNSGVNNEPIRLGARLDNAVYNQNYVAQWDWIFVRKKEPSTISVSFGSEIAATSPFRFTGLTAGSYDIKVNEAGGCLYTETVVVSQPAVVAGGTISNPVSTTLCYGADPAAFTSTTPASGGAGTTTYQWQYKDNGNRKALVFDGTNDYGLVTANVPETNFTIEFWFKTTATNTGLFAVTDGALGANGHDRHFWINASGQANQRIHSGATYNTGTVVNDGKWHHWALTAQTGVGLRTYIDGVQVGSHAYDHSDFNWQTQFHIGYSNDASNPYFNGQIDELRIWTTPLSQATIAAYNNRGVAKDHPNYANLFDEWKFDEESGTAIYGTKGTNGTLVNGVARTSDNWHNISGATSITYDSPALTTDMKFRRVATNTCGSANSNEVEVTMFPQVPQVPSVTNNTPVCYGLDVTLTATGMAPGGTGYNFNSSGQIITTPNLSLGDGYTLESWFKTPLASHGTWHTLFRSGTIHHHVLAEAGTNVLGVYNNTTGGFRTSGYDLDNLAPGWHHIAAVGTGNNTDFYIDGNYVGSSDFKPTTDLNNIGACCTDQVWGEIDNVRIWTRPLSLDQIRDNMYLVTPVLSTGLLAHYKLDGNANDSQGSNHGTLSGSPATITPDHIVYGWSGPQPPTPASNTSETRTITNTSAATTGSYTVTPSANSCTGSGVSTTVTVNGPATTTTWTGTVDTDWHKHPNWTQCIPDTVTVTIIPAAPTNQPVIFNGNIGKTKTLETQTGSDVLIQSGANLEVKP